MSITPPDPNVIRAQLVDGTAKRQFTATEFRKYNSESTRQVEYGIDDAAYIGARDIMEPRLQTNSLKSPFVAIPMAENREQYYEAVRVFSSIQPSDPNSPMQAQTSYFADDPNLPADAPSRGYHYANLADEARGGDDPAKISYVPTSTTDPGRPRTVAAGYDPYRKILTVVFRDGTYYNYYDVNNLTWANFKRSYSPGQFIKQHLDDHPRGVADAASMPTYAREAFYKVARTGQTLRGGLTGTQTASSRRRYHQNYGKNLGGTGRARLKRYGSGS